MRCRANAVAARQPVMKVRGREGNRLRTTPVCGRTETSFSGRERRARLNEDRARPRASIVGAAMHAHAFGLAPFIPLSTIAGPRSSHPGNPMKTSALLLLGIAVASGQAWSATAGKPAAAPDAPAALPTVVVFKDPSCGCCGNWVEHMRKHGFTVQVHDSADMAAVKRSMGVPAGKASCHTARVGGLVIEGHVPAGDVIRLLAKPDGAIGLTAPGMPIGSPGMETPDGREQAYTVERINRDGSTSPFAKH
jgi:hypothetical protein